MKLTQTHHFCVRKTFPVNITRIAQLLTQVSKFYCFHPGPLTCNIYEQYNRLRWLIMEEVPL